MAPSWESVRTAAVWLVEAIPSRAAVADYAQELVVRHHVHDAGIDAHAPIGASEGVHLVLLIHLEVQRDAVHGIQALRQRAETLRVGVRLRQHLALRVKLGDVLVDIGLDLFVGQGHGLRGDHASLEKTGRIERFGAGDEHQHAGCEGKKSFHDTANINKSLQKNPCHFQLVEKSAYLCV